MHMFLAPGRIVDSIIVDTKANPLSSIHLEYCILLIVNLV